MLRTPLSACRKSLRTMGSALALACVLSGGAVIGTAASSLPAAAQDEDEKPSNSQGFAEVYTPLAEIVNAPDGDMQAAVAQIPGMIDAIENNTDRMIAGNMLLILGGKTSDQTLQRRGLQMMVDSGQAPPEQLPTYYYYLGNLAFGAGDLPAAQAALQQAVDLGFNDTDTNDLNDPGFLLAQSYFRQDNKDEGLSVLKDITESRLAAGDTPSEDWFLAGLQTAYDLGATERAAEWGRMLVTHHDTKENWRKSLIVANDLASFEAQAQLDLLRLMNLTGAMQDRSYFVRYIEAADPRIMSNEIAPLLDDAVAAGALSPSDEYYVEIKRIVDDRAAQDQADIGGLVETARASSDAQDAIDAADVLYSLGDYAQAEEFYQMALDNGAADRDEALTRLGIVQARQGKLDAARATLSQVGGPRSTVACFWTACSDTQA